MPRKVLPDFLHPEPADRHHPACRQGVHRLAEDTDGGRSGRAVHGPSSLSQGKTRTVLRSRSHRCSRTIGALDRADRWRSNRRIGCPMGTVWAGLHGAPVRHRVMMMPAVIQSMSASPPLHRTAGPARPRSLRRHVPTPRSARRLRGPGRLGQDDAAQAVQDLAESRGLRRRHDEVELVGSDQADHQEPQGGARAQPGGVLAAPRGRFPASRRAEDSAGALERQAGDRRPLPLHRPRARRGARPRSRLGAEAVSAAPLARHRLLLLGVAGHVEPARVGASRTPNYYEAGQDVTADRRSDRKLRAVHHAGDPRVRVAGAHLQLHHGRRRAVDRRAAPRDPQAVSRVRAARPGPTGTSTRSPSGWRCAGGAA